MLMLGTIVIQHDQGTDELLVTAMASSGRVDYRGSLEDLPDLVGYAAQIVARDNHERKT